MEAGATDCLTRAPAWSRSAGDPLKEFFEGNEALFAGLYIHHRHDWSQRHPVVRIGFGRGTFQEPRPAYGPAGVPVLT
ncbi:MAG: hypothetical protein OXH96_19685 [Spirochaetaceae bacterium]|nr:hypothetical protein [Spirochaetaceae bacterium]